MGEVIEKPKVLIVDDVRNNLISMRHILSKLDAELFLADSGEDALVLVMKHDFAVVLLDVQMPGLNGFETAELIRQNKFSETIPIIFVTAINEEKVNQFEGYSSGAVDFLFKPIDSLVLLSKVKIFVGMYNEKIKKTNTLLQELSDLNALNIKLEKNVKSLEVSATHDSLTNLPNRSQFERELNQSLSYCKRHVKEFAVLFVDLDGFKAVNDTLGHHVGNNLLQILATRLKAIVRKEDTVARLGGDEFGVVLHQIENFEAAGAVAQHICNSFNEKVDIGSNVIQVSCSVGIACFPFAGNTACVLMQHADIAMFQAKEKGKNAFEFFTETLSEEYTQRAGIEKALKTAIKNKEFRLVYQTIYELSTMKPISVEALLRWDSETLGEIQPDIFIPIAEETGTIQSIGNWVFETVCEHLSAWEKQHSSSISFAINLSSKQLLNEDLLMKAEQIMTKGGIHSGKLELELTEAALMDKRSGEKVVEMLNKFGIKVNIDDFGTSYSSLTKLRRLPVGALKIDKSFIKGALKNKNDAIIVKAILSLAKGLGLRTIAEGIESQAQLDFLIENGCDMGQGFFLSKPLMPESALDLFLEHSNGKKP